MDYEIPMDEIFVTVVSQQAGDLVAFAEKSFADKLRDAYYLYDEEDTLDTFLQIVDDEWGSCLEFTLARGDRTDEDDQVLAYLGEHLLSGQSRDEVLGILGSCEYSFARFSMTDTCAELIGMEVILIQPEGSGELIEVFMSYSEVY
jgi:hypothetical protein